MNQNHTKWRRVSTGVIFVALVLLSSNAALAIEFDISFGSGGKFMTSFGTSGQPSSAGSHVYIQPTGRIVVVGTHSQQGTSVRTSGFGLAGLTSFGTLDANYGMAGKVVEWSADSHSFLTKSVMLPDGSILVLYQQWHSVAANRPVLAKYTPAGQADVNFAADIDVASNETSPVTIAPGLGGKIYAIVRVSQTFHILRLNPNGSRDTTFGTNGVRPLNLSRFASQTAVFSLNELADGKLIVAGTYYSSFEGLTFVARFNSDTNIDRSFGTQGAVRISHPGGTVNGVTTEIQPDGKILIAGCWTFLGSNTLLIRLTPRGRLDTGFGTGGMTMTSYNNTNIIREIVVGLDGRITVVGNSGDKAIPSNQRVFVMRYSPTGVRESFLVTNFITTREAWAFDVLLQGDGKILIAGFTQNPSDTLGQLVVARFLP